MSSDIRKVAVVGTGLLGTQIAILAAGFGYEVSVFDTDSGSLGRSVENIRQSLNATGKKPIFAAEEWEGEVEKIRSCAALEDAVQHADLVIEAVPEILALKREVFSRIDSAAPQHAILATNSSSMPISRIADGISSAQRCVNMHFYQPALGINMVDIMGGGSTANDVIERAARFVRSLGCVPLMVRKEILGFCFNRVWRSVKREILYMWSEGFVDYRDIDRAWMIAYGTPQGPFGMMDGIGLEVVYDIEMSYYNESGDAKDHPPDALKAMIERNELGVKTGKGFYTYPGPEFRNPDFLKG